jgi:alanine dehydrogenase
MDGTYLTNLRTGAAGAVAARHLARAESATAGFVGAGQQAYTQLAGLMVTMPALTGVVACDLRTEAAEQFCRWCRDEHGLQARPAADLEELVRRSDILTTTTPSRAPLVMDEWVRPGTHVNAIGADAAGKQELDPALLKRSVLVIDEWEQASHSGEINVPLSQGAISRDDVHGDIGQVVTGRIAGRQTAGQITIFDSTGLAVQDMSCALEAYRRASNEGPSPSTIAFFGSPEHAS